MFELRTKTNTHYGLLIDDELIKFRTKKKAVEIGRSLIKTNPDIKLIEEYYHWIKKYDGKFELADHKQIDRTNILLVY